MAEKRFPQTLLMEGEMSCPSFWYGDCLSVGECIYDGWLRARRIYWCWRCLLATISWLMQLKAQNQQESPNIVLRAAKKTLQLRRVQWTVALFVRLHAKIRQLLVLRWRWWNQRREEGDVRFKNKNKKIRRIWIEENVKKTIKKLPRASSQRSV